MHKVVAGEVTAGFFTLTNTPVNTQCVMTDANGGGMQVNKDCVGTSAATPDFQILNSNQLHINNNGGATGLSASIKQNDVLIICYYY